MIALLIAWAAVSCGPESVTSTSSRSTALESTGQAQPAPATTWAWGPEPDHVVQQKLRSQIGALHQKYGDLAPAQWDASDRTELEGLYSELRARLSTIQGARAPSIVPRPPALQPTQQQLSAYLSAAAAIPDRYTPEGQEQVLKLKEQYLGKAQ